MDDRNQQIMEEMEARRLRSEASAPVIVRKERAEIQPDKGVRQWTCNPNFYTVRSWRPRGLRELPRRLHQSDSGRSEGPTDSGGQPRLGDTDTGLEEWNHAENSAHRPEEDSQTRLDYQDYSARQCTPIIRLADGTRRQARGSSDLHGSTNGSCVSDPNDSILNL